MSKYRLPDLPYDYAALEPHISAEIMRLHHDKHHAAYVEKANLAIAQLDDARQRQDWVRIPGLERALAFNLAGHVMHSIFWRNLSPDGGGQPGSALAEAIDRDFLSFDLFKRQMVEVASTVMGSGWAALVWEPIGERLLLAQIYDHQSNLSEGAMPIMVLDAWEHAYYLQYQNRKAEFFEAVWNVWNWKDIAERYESARTCQAVLAGAASR